MLSMLVGGFIEQKNFCTFLRIAVKSFFFPKECATCSFAKLHVSLRKLVVTFLIAIRGLIARHGVGFVVST